MDFNLPLFPSDSAAITMTTTVWVGVVVSIFFNLRLGWNLAAIVAPGYLVPLLISRPITVAMILLEAILTYLVARLISDALKRYPFWSSFFGRDRFFVIVVISVLIRAVFDQWILPAIGQTITETYDWNFDYRNELKGFGLIAIALLANYFWKPGLRGGIAPCLTSIAVTWLIVYYPLGQLTNLSLGNFHLMYEDISASLVESPKTYILLISTAYLASWVNLRFAWDFNGILIPALLGLMLHEPFKILTSCVECLLIYSIGSLLLKTPWLRQVSMQGGKKLLFFFTICFALRFAVAHLVPLTGKHFEVSDAFGLGYVLSTLMAIKAYDKKILIRVFKGTLQVSLVGGIAGSLIGFGLFLFTEHTSPTVQASAATGERQPLVVAENSAGLPEVVRSSKLRLYPSREEQLRRLHYPSYKDLVRFHFALVEIRKLQHQFLGQDSVRLPRNQLQAIARELDKIHFELIHVGGSQLVIREKSPSQGWGMYIVNLKSLAGACLEVPAPLKEWATMESCLELSHEIPWTGIAVAGKWSSDHPSHQQAATRITQPMFHVFRSVFGQSQSLEIRGLTASLRRTLDGPDANNGTTQQSRLYIDRELPESLSLLALNQKIGRFDVHWNQAPLDIPGRRSDQQATLVLTRAQRQQLLAASYSSNSPNDSFDSTTASITPVVTQQMGIQAYLRDIKAAILNQSSNEFTPAELDDMLLMDHEVVGPLVDLMAQFEYSADDQSDTATQNAVNGTGDTGGANWLTQQRLQELNGIHAAAQTVGYKIDLIEDTATNDIYVVLAEDVLADSGAGQAPNDRKGWGTFLFRPGLAEDYAIEIPRPLFESRSFDFGVSLFQRPRASALLIAGAHPRTNQDGSADISKIANRKNLFNLVRQVLLQKLNQRPYLICQARAIQAPVRSDVVIATDDGVTNYGRLSPLKKQFTQSLLDDKFSIGFVDGSHDTAGYELGLMLKAASFQIAQHKEILSLWLSPSLRAKYRPQSFDNQLTAQMAACGIAIHQTRLVDHLTATNHVARTIFDESLPDEMRTDLRRYIENFDVIQLSSINTRYPDWPMEYVLDESSGQAFLLVNDRKNRLTAALNLTGYLNTEQRTTTVLDRSVVHDFISSRQMWLEVQP